MNERGFNDRTPLDRLESCLNIGDYEGALEIYNEIYSEIFKFYESAIELQKIMEIRDSFIKNKAYYRLFRACAEQVKDTRKMLSVLSGIEEYILTKPNLGEEKI